MSKTSFGEFKRELLGDPEVLAEYKALQPKYKLIRSLIKRRTELGMTQSRLAKLVGIRQPAISRLERGEGNITLETVSRITNVLNLDITVKDRKSGKVLV